MALTFDRRKGHFYPGSGAVTLANLQPIASNRILGRVSAGTGPVEELPPAQAKQVLDLTGVTTAVVNGKAPSDSPALTGTPTAPTAAAGTNTTQLSTTAFVHQAIADLVASSPAALDTLNELAAALGNDANFAATMTSALAGKQAAHALLSAIAALSPTAGQAIVGDGTTFAMQALLTAASADTLTNKRITNRVGGVTSSATPGINTDSYDIYRLTAQAVDITSFTTNLTGTPTAGQLLEIWITGTAARAITWGASFASTTVTLPTTTVGTATLRVVLQWDDAISKWACVGVV